ncbi:hypothetical protein TCDM_10636 [Trypanosoma cruzi Dm28c]|uniref:Uncharacterized protein n=1 Tax=Trypanosoma cruzi Dm28c TaxID=1416333 RepID=V5BBI6_TRYCR|nr:hypothetical protein TCDM_10636 [Trypanosoma cruzi Dm28c]
MRDSDQRCWVRQPPQTAANPRADVTAQHSLAAQLSHQTLCHPSLHEVAATDRCRLVSIAAPCRRMDGSIGGKLTPPQFIGAGVFMRRHIHREGNGGPFLFPCTAGRTVATCVHRMGHMAHSTQLTIPAMHAHIKATESIILILSLSTRSRTLLPRTHTHAIAHAAVTRSTRHIHRHNHRICSRHTHGRAAAAHKSARIRRRAQLPACAAKEAFKIHCNVHLVCVPEETQSKEVEKREQSMWRNAQKCTAEVRGGNNNKKKTAQTHDCTAAQAAAIHTKFIQNKKRSFPFNLHKPHHTK